MNQFILPGMYLSSPNGYIYDDLTINIPIPKKKRYRWRQWVYKMPFRCLPPLINHENKFIKDLIKKRLEIGK